jgi:hypothetical protein
MSSDRLARLIAFGAPGQFGQRLQPFFDFRGQAQSEHENVRESLFYMYSTAVQL